MAQPKIELLPDPLDKLLLGITIFFGLFLVVYPLVNYVELPSEIPVHFGADGTADRYGNKLEIWIIPFIGVLLTIFLRWLATMPHTFNYSVKITPANAADQYKIGARLINILSTIIIVAFTYITYGTIQVAKGTNTGLSVFFLPILLGAIFITIAYTINQSFKKEK